MHHIQIGLPMWKSHSTLKHRRALQLLQRCSGLPVTSHQAVRETSGDCGGQILSTSLKWSGQVQRRPGGRRQ